MRRSENQSRGTTAEDGQQLASILIVDDRPGNLLSLRSILEPLGQKIVHASSGDEALRQVLANEFAVILMDVRMPGMDGVRTAQLIRQRPRSAQVPIIFLTAVSIESAEIIKAYEQGAVDFILKPFEPAILRSKVKVFVELYLKEEMIKRQAALLMERDRRAFQRRSLMRFRSLLDSMPIAVMALKPDGTVYYWNKTVSEWVRTPMANEAASPLSIVCPEDRDRVAAAWNEALAQGKALETQFRMQRKSDGAYRWYLCRIVPQRDEDGQIGSWICTATDIDRHYEAREVAESANRMKDEFLATVSHELRNPLSAILGWTRLLRVGNLSGEKAAHAIEIIERNARNQAALVDEMLDIARITRGKLHLDLVPIDFAQVAETALAAARPLAEGKEIALDYHVAEGAVPAEVSGDASRLQQVVSNLLSNAIKFTQNRGWVRVELRHQHDALELTVADNGQGIRADFLPFVFERFRQAESGATRVYAGLGIGLSVSREIVELHGGSISAHSEGEGRGATFTVSIPCRPAPGGDLAADSGGAEPELSLAGIKVLVVDDEADAREMLAETLADFGAQTVLAASAGEALAAISSKPDVILSDIGMPLEDGYSLIRRIRELPPAEGGLIPAGALTGWATPQEARRALAEGFQLHITKPVDVERLIAVVHRLASGLSGV